jgi:tRNA pseudouridine38-40 synthase
MSPSTLIEAHFRFFFSFIFFRHCESRKYTYFFPTYLLIPPKPDSGIHRALTDQLARDPDAPSPPTPTCDFWEHGNNGSPEEDLVRKRSWRVGPEQVQSLRKIVEKFEGTHNFHNFTAGREASDPSCRRHMKEIQVSQYGLYYFFLKIILLI